MIFSFQAGEPFMFGKPDPVKIIRKGDLERLKKAVEKYPELLKEDFSWERFTGDMVGAASCYNQPEIINYLVTKKGMSVESTNWTYLHVASKFDAYDAAQELLALGVDPALKNSKGHTAYGVAGSSRMEKLLRPYHEEQQRQQEIARQEEIAAKAVGTWTSVLPDEVMRERELPGGKYQLTDIFNFSTEVWTRLTKDLQSGAFEEDTKFFSEIPNKEIVNQARAALKELGGNPGNAESAKPSAAKAQPKIPPAPDDRYDHLKI
jgi:hypothetical protein